MLCYWYTFTEFNLADQGEEMHTGIKGREGPGAQVCRVLCLLVCQGLHCSERPGTACGTAGGKEVKQALLLAA